MPRGEAKLLLGFEGRREAIKGRPGIGAALEQGMIRMDVLRSLVIGVSA